MKIEINSKELIILIDALYTQIDTLLKNGSEYSKVESLLGKLEDTHLS